MKEQSGLMPYWEGDSLVVYRGSSWVVQPCTASWDRNAPLSGIRDGVCEHLKPGPTQERFVVISSLSSQKEGMAGEVRAQFYIVGCTDALFGVLFLQFLVGECVIDIIVKYWKWKECCLFCALA